MVRPHRAYEVIERIWFLPLESWQLLKDLKQGSEVINFVFLKRLLQGTFLVIQWPKLCIPNGGGGVGGRFNPWSGN